MNFCHLGAILAVTGMAPLIATPVGVALKFVLLLHNPLPTFSPFFYFFPSLSIPTLLCILSLVTREKLLFFLCLFLEKTSIISRILSCFLQCYGDDGAHDRVSLYTHGTTIQKEVVFWLRCSSLSFKGIRYVLES